MIERERRATTTPTPSSTRSAPETFPTATVVPVKPALTPSPLERDGFIALRACFDEPLRRMERLQCQLIASRPSLPVETIPPPPHPVRVRAEHGLLLQATFRYLERLQNVPLLKAPPSFEDAFAPYEPIFHTLFFRKYPYHLQADAKQEALLRLWLQWRRDMTLLEQTPAFVVQAALWGASPWGKKRAKIEARELPMPKDERYFEAHTGQASRDPGWVERIDLVTDVQRAIERVRTLICHSEDFAHLEIALQDVLAGTTRKAGQCRSQLSIRTYKRSRDWVENALRDALAEYRPPTLRAEKSPDCHN